MHTRSNTCTIHKHVHYVHRHLAPWPQGRNPLWGLNSLQGRRARGPSAPPRQQGRSGKTPLTKLGCNICSSCKVIQKTVAIACLKGAQPCLQSPTVRLWIRSSCYEWKYIRYFSKLYISYLFYAGLILQYGWCLYMYRYVDSSYTVTLAHLHNRHSSALCLSNQ